MTALNAVALLRLKLNANNPKSDVVSDTPLAAFIHIYTHARVECYLDHMEGAKILNEWLGPFTISKYADVTIPYLLRTYELHELAKIVHPQNVNFAEDAIYCDFIKQAYA